MTIAIAAVCGLAIWTAVAFPVAVVIGRAIHTADPGEDGPDGTAGDLLADQPAEVRVDDVFRALTDPLEAERDARLGGAW
ncbi:MAG TPA: hypothetical protein VFV01_16995 [Spirillospora sp.]|nr:hypothetical protein [Spirillospora sp.]